MKEIDIKVTDDKLAEEWFIQADESISAAIRTIDLLETVYQFSFYDNNEDLPENELKTKIAIKNTNIYTPIAYAVEQMIKSVIILYKYHENP